RHEPHRVAIVNLAPVVGHAYLHATVEDVVALITCRRIFNPSARRIVWVVTGLLADRITLAAALNLSHRRSGLITTQSRLDARKVTRVVNACGNTQHLSFPVDARVAIARARMVAQEAATTTALLFERAEHVRKIAWIVAGSGHDLRTENVRFS